MIQRLGVYMSFERGQETPVGTLARSGRRLFFEYDPAFLAAGPEISPFRLARGPGLHENREWEVGSLPGVFDDSLPDGWGLLLMDREFHRRGIDLASVSPLDRLAFLGDRAMGALTYRPGEEPPADRSPFSLARLAAHAEEVYEGEAVDVLPQLIRAGGSPGGARPKILVGMSGERLISGESALPRGYDPWMVAAHEAAHAVSSSLVGLAVRDTDPEPFVGWLRSRDFLRTSAGVTRIPIGTTWTGSGS
ncbi:MAG: HipA N-terminal domain-containing protein [Candidatus Riflebacteria bacterium]|nr:HipA N-terminal domain-containing protein [Candidatus Riflebacteria bacterium]